MSVQILLFSLIFFIHDERPDIAYLGSGRESICFSELNFLPLRVRKWNYSTVNFFNRQMSILFSKPLQIGSAFYILMALFQLSLVTLTFTLTLALTLTFILTLTLTLMLKLTLRLTLILTLPLILSLTLSLTLTLILTLTFTWTLILTLT